MGKIAVRTSGLTKDFTIGLRGLRLRAVDSLDLEVPAGSIFGLLGPNGSGKSTTLKILLGLQNPTRGSFEILGHSGGGASIRSRIGFLPESPAFSGYLTGREQLSYLARLSGLDGSGLGERVKEVLACVGLEMAADRKTGIYSKGMLQRLGLAQAIVHDPQLLILDEPTSGLDPIGSEKICRLLLELKSAGKTIILSSHLLGRREGICDQFAILDRGRLIISGEVDEILEKGDRLTVEVENLNIEKRSIIADAIRDLGGVVTHVRPSRQDLDRLFIDLVGGEERPGDGGEAGQS